jgi:microsomal dipeptidase-like Zn-dependent dipeptidase
MLRRREYRERHPLQVADISEVVARIEHEIEIAGVDHVGLGSGFDGGAPGGAPVG